MMCCLSEHYEEAETFFEMATTSDPDNIIAWVMTGMHNAHSLAIVLTAPLFLGLFYESTSNQIMCDMAYERAARLNYGPRTKTLVNFATSSDKSSRRKSTLKAVPITSSLKQQSSGGHVPQVYVRAPTLSGAQASSSSTKMTESETGQNIGTNGGGQNDEVADDVANTIDATKTSTPTTVAPESAQPIKKPMLNVESSVSFKDDIVSVHADPSDDAKANNAEKRALTTTPTTIPLKDTSSVHNAATTSAISFGDIQKNEYDQDEDDAQQSCFLQTASYLLDIHAMKVS